MAVPICACSSLASLRFEEDDGGLEARQRRREADEEGRRKSWARGEATMNHAEVRLMMEMMRQAKTGKEKKGVV